METLCEKSKNGRARLRRLAFRKLPGYLFFSLTSAFVKIRRSRQNFKQAKSPQHFESTGFPTSIDVKLSLRELWSLTCLLELVLLTFFHTRIACKESWFVSLLPTDFTAI